ncbi:MAG: hypothetical protein NUV81_01485 [bacterium]|nr:hypothetical protein [bacterium]
MRFFVTEFVQRSFQTRRNCVNANIQKPPQLIWYEVIVDQQIPVIWDRDADVKKEEPLQKNGDLRRGVDESAVSQRLGLALFPERSIMSDVTAFAFAHGYAHATLEELLSLYRDHPNAHLGHIVAYGTIVRVFHPAHNIVSASPMLNWSWRRHRLMTAGHSSHYRSKNTAYLLVEIPR